MVKSCSPTLKNLISVSFINKPLDGFSPQFTQDALSLVTSSVRCSISLYQIDVFGPLFQVDLRNDPLTEKITPAQSSHNSSETIEDSKGSVIPNHTDGRKFNFAQVVQT